MKYQHSENSFALHQDYVPILLHLSHEINLNIEFFSFWVKQDYLQLKLQFDYP